MNLHARRAVYGYCDADNGGLLGARDVGLRQFGPPLRAEKAKKDSDTLVTAHALTEAEQPGQRAPNYPHAIATLDTRRRGRANA